MTKKEQKSVKIGSVLKRLGFRNDFETIEVTNICKDPMRRSERTNNIFVIGKWKPSWYPDAKPVEGIRWEINSRDIILEKV